MTFYLLIAAIDFIVGLLALSKKGNKATTALALVCISAGVWSIELFLLTYLQDPNTLDFWFHLARLGMFLIPPSLALLVSQLVRAQSSLFRRFIIYPGFILALVQFALNNTVYPSTLRPAIGGYLPAIDWIYYSFVFNFAFCFIGSILFASVAFQTAISRDKQRIKWLLITVAVTFLSASLSLYLMAYDFYLSKFISSTSNIIFMVLLFHATVRHHLLDIRLAITMALSRVVLLAILAGGYALINLSVPGLPSDAGALLAFSLLFLLALELYPTVLKWLEPNAKRLFWTGNYEYEEVVARAGAQLRQCTSYGDVTKLLDYIFRQVINVKSYQLFLLDPATDERDVRAVSINGVKVAVTMNRETLMLEPQRHHSTAIMVDETQPGLKQQLTTLSASCFLPLQRHSQLEAMVLVGESLAGSYYRYDDIRLMEWLAEELPQALYRISAYQKLDGELAEAKKKLSMLGVMNLYHHDIKAPLSIIDGVVSNHLYDDEKRRSIILEQVAWGSRLIATMAQLLKTDRKRKTGPVVLQEVLDDCCFVFKRSMEHLTVEHSGAFTVEADADDLKILFINVIKNAVEASQPGSAVKLRIKSWVTPNNNAYVAITDNGVGMTPQQLDCLWLNLGSTKQGGNGIGLQAIKKIADEHNANIKVNSAPGKGTTFTFEFPCLESDSGVSAVPQNSLA